MALKKCSIANRVVTAGDGEEALDYLFGKGKHAGRKRGLPDLVLLDLKLPKLSGIDVLAAVRSGEETRFLPVVVLTVSKETRDLFDAYRLGANSYVHKPIDFDAFTETVRGICSYWLFLNEPPPLP